MKKMKIFQILILLIIISSEVNAQNFTIPDSERSGVSLIVLGTVQDGGSPHIGCKKSCCAALFEEPDKNRKVVSLGIVDASNDAKYLFEATPDIITQMKALAQMSTSPQKEVPDGIFLTHAHIGHYTGLMYLGKEAMGARDVKVFAMPEMKNFLENNGPWSQLVSGGNISISPIQNQIEVSLSQDLKVVPLKVPHRDEYSETVGFRIIGPDKTALFIPDIDKWHKWERDIKSEIRKADYAFLDATFYDAAEINNRDISEIPHPFIIESISLFKDFPEEEKKKIYFIHMNHTNPALDVKSEQYSEILGQGFNVARIYDEFKL
ncbi:MBL fold metallo-hydrolase [Gramella jeungdoensis]|uniref:MBL fold metallo-hydrolase n=1 Tax=Gramella jeungdoensis TaxID=708091 RepID=A0ABT0Z1H5_9FLAO|nr:MBL fold metallo-hydrolase [Gramella jeungdoensis]MCM8568649.1 MBL fold metallo-hydrolase [Gramella jeungdoensis]